MHNVSKFIIFDFFLLIQILKNDSTLEKLFEIYFNMCILMFECMTFFQRFCFELHSLSSFSISASAPIGRAGDIETEALIIPTGSFIEGASNRSHGWRRNS